MSTSERERFSVASKLLAEARAVYQDHWNAIARQGEAAMLARALELLADNPQAKRRKDYRLARDESQEPMDRVLAVTRLFGAGAFQPLREAREAAFDALSDLWSGLRKDVERELDEAAQGAEVRPGPARMLTEVWTSSYSSQGLGASRYARQSAELTASQVRALGITASVKRETGGGPKPADYLEHWQVFVEVEGDLDVEILKRRKVPLRDWVAGCWRAGVNPRVYDPFLPHGIEERLGIDYQGRRVDPAGVSV